MTTKHTPEPWTHENGNRWIHCDSTGAAICRVAEDDGVGERPRSLPHEANGRRIAACVNALAGIADPEAAIKASREAIGNLFIEIDHMTNDRAGFPRKAVMDHARRALAMLNGKGA